MTKLIVILVLLLIILAVIYTMYKTIQRKISNFSSSVLGSTNLLEGLKQVEEIANDTPLSVSGGDSIYLPRIQKDFPDFSKSIVENVIKKFLLEYFSCLENKSISKLTSVNYTASVNAMILSEISDLNTNNSSKIFDNIIFHKIAISMYSKNLDSANVKLQIALEYTTVKDGSTNTKVQSKYEINYTYTFKDTETQGFSLRCSYCGAPLEGTSATCNYCGTQVIRNIGQVWKISSLKKLI